jgi:prevent-host-death family protein
MSVYPLAEARTHLGELVAEARHSHRPVTITEHGKPVVALINVDDLADLEDGLAVARHLADKAAGRVTGTVIRTEADIDAAIDAFEAENA